MTDPKARLRGVRPVDQEDPTPSGPLRSDGWSDLRGSPRPVAKSVVECSSKQLGVNVASDNPGGAAREITLGMETGEILSHERLDGVNRTVGGHPVGVFGPKEGVEQGEVGQRLGPVSAAPETRERLTPDPVPFVLREGRIPEDVGGQVEALVQQ